jgi:hypothetical protein
MKNVLLKSLKQNYIITIVQEFSIFIMCWINNYIAHPLMH